MLFTHHQYTSVYLFIYGPYDTRRLSASSSGEILSVETSQTGTDESIGLKTVIDVLQNLLLSSELSIMSSLSVVCLNSIDYCVLSEVLSSARAYGFAVLFVQCSSMRSLFEPVGVVFTLCFGVRKWQFVGVYTAVNSETRLYGTCLISFGVNEFYCIILKHLLFCSHFGPT